MKRILKTILISFLCVIGAVGLLVGGFYLFGGNEEKVVYAEDLYFNITNTVVDGPFSLKVSTNTEGVTKKKVRLNVSTGGNRILDIPQYANIDEPVTIYLKKDDKNNNVGGSVQITATYDDDNANVSAVGKCEVLVDVGVVSATISVSSVNVVPKQSILLCPEDEDISKLLSIYPLKSLIPNMYEASALNPQKKKQIWIEMVDLVTGNALNCESTNYDARFIVNGEEKTSNIIEVNYHYVSSLSSQAEPKLVFDDSVYIKAGQSPCSVKINAYVCSTFKEQEKIETEEKPINQVATVTASTGFEIGNIQISNFNFDDSTKEIYLDLRENNNKADDDCINIFVNNEDAGSGDINLGLTLASSSEGVEIGQYYLWNMYLSIDNKDYRLLCNGNNEKDSELLTEFVRLKYEGISSLKEDWCWKIKLNNFLAYENETLFNAQLKYIEYEKNSDGTEDVSNIKIELPVQTFRIKPIVNEVTNLDVVYKAQADESFRVKSGEKFSLAATDFRVTPNTATFVKDRTNYLQYYLSGAENDDLSALPSAFVKDVYYKATFSFTIDESASIYLANFSYGNLVYLYLKQRGSDLEYYKDYVENDESLNETKHFDAENIIDGFIIFKNSATTAVLEEEFSINLEFWKETSTEIFAVNINKLIDYSVKVYEGTTYESTKDVVKGFSNFPYLSVDGLRYYADFDYTIYDADPSVKYLRLKKFAEFESNLTAEEEAKVFEIDGIGKFTITAILVFEDVDGTIYWLDKSCLVDVEVYQTLNSIVAYSSKDGGVFETNYTENDENKYWVYVSSSTMDVLKNYVDYNKLEVGFNQIFDADALINQQIIDEHEGIENINADAIIFDSNWTAVYDEGVLVGFKIGYTINEVKTINIGLTEYSPKFEIFVRVKVDEEYVYCNFCNNEVGGVKDFETGKLTVNIKDGVVTESFVLYDGNAKTQSEPLVIYASVDSNKVVYQNFNDADLSYGFKNADSSLKTTNTLDLEPLNCNKNINFTELYNFERKDNGIGGLSFKNIPYYDDGVLVEMGVSSSTIMSFNSYWKWNGTGFEETMYDLTSSIFIKIYGLDITITDKENEVKGKKDEEVDLFGSGGLFGITVKGGSSKTTYTSINDYSNILAVNSFNKNLVVNDSLTKVTIKQDILQDTLASFRFDAGALSERNSIKVNGNSQASVSVVSPFVVTYTVGFDCPNTNQQFYELTYDGSADLPENISTILSIVPYKIDGTDDDSGDYYKDLSGNVINDIANLATLNEDKTLNFKTYTKAYCFNLKFQIIQTIIDEETEEETNNSTSSIYRLVTITPILEDTDLVVGTFDNVNNKYYLTSGETYSFVDGGITYGTNFTPEIKDMVNSLQITAEDLSELTEDDCATVDKHVKIVIPTNVSGKQKMEGFSIGLYDLNFDKDVKFTFTFTFSDGGYYVFEKVVEIRKNTEINLNQTTLIIGDANNNYIKLNDDNAYFVTISGAPASIDFANKFSFEGEDPNTYSENSFEFDSTIFSPGKVMSTYRITLIGTQPGETQIKFKYKVEGNQEYILTFVFNVEIVNAA